MYVVTGATGNTGKRVAESLLKAGKQVVAVSRSAEHLKGLVAQGATAAVGSLEDAAFLTQTFQGATAIYAMIPPSYTAPDFRAYQASVGNAIAGAVKASGVKHVVTLSSVGAHLSEKSGVVLGAHWFEKRLAENPASNTLNLRAGFFMQNFFGNIGIIQAMHINGGFPVQGDIRFGIIHTDDIADYAVKRLLALDFTGHRHQNLAGQRDLSLIEATAILGKSIGKPELPWVTFSYADAKAGMVQAGLSESLASLYVEFGEAMNNGTMLSDFTRTPESTTPTSIEVFAEKEFAPAFAAAAAHQPA